MLILSNILLSKLLLLFCFFCFISLNTGRFCWNSSFISYHRSIKPFHLLKTKLQHLSQRCHFTDKIGGKGKWPKGVGHSEMSLIWCHKQQFQWFHLADFRKLWIIAIYWHYAINLPKILKALRILLTSFHSVKLQWYDLMLI